jgi:hypothetical protein
VPASGGDSRSNIRSSVYQLVGGSQAYGAIVVWFVVRGSTVPASVLPQAIGTVIVGSVLP